MKLYQSSIFKHDEFEMIEDCSDQQQEPSRIVTQAVSLLPKLEDVSRNPLLCLAS